MWFAVELAFDGHARGERELELCAIGARMIVGPPKIDRRAIGRTDPWSAWIGALDQPVVHGEDACRPPTIEHDIDATWCIEMCPHDATTSTSH